MKLCYIDRKSYTDYGKLNIFQIHPTDEHNSCAPAVPTPKSNKLSEMPDDVINDMFRNLIEKKGMVSN